MSERIRFVCPSCSASHCRGYIDGVRTFRCLGCGYMGYGYHSDAEIDREIRRDIDAANAANRKLELPLETAP